MWCVGATLFGTVVFPAIFILLQTYFKTHFSSRLSQVDICEICIRCVSSIQAVMSCTAGFIVIHQCQDIMYDSCWLTDWYASFALPYFYYDLWAMFHRHCLTEQYSHDVSLHRKVRHFLLDNKLMIIHHAVLPAIFFPIIIFFRKNLGDFFVGVFYLFEMAVPFIAARFILVQLQLKATLCYVLTSLVMILAFAVSRVAIFPYLYWRYASHAHIPVLAVPSAIPVKCSAGCTFVLVFQLYWLFLMVRGAARAFRKMYRTHRHSSWTRSTFHVRDAPSLDTQTAQLGR